jgi:hypothetical protein
MESETIKTPKESVEKSKSLTPAQIAHLAKMREKKAVKKKAAEMLRDMKQPAENVAHVAPPTQPTPAATAPVAPQVVAPVAPTQVTQNTPSIDPELYELKTYLKQYMQYKDAKKRVKQQEHENTYVDRGYDTYYPQYRIVRR